jgi:hypothetical protein
MKNIPTFETFLNESSTGFELKDDSGQGKATIVLKLDHTAWEKVKHLFDDAGRPNHEDVKRIPSQNSIQVLNMDLNLSDLF